MVVCDYFTNLLGFDTNYLDCIYICSQQKNCKWDGHIEILNPFGDLLASGKMKEQFIVYNIKINKDQSKSKNFIRMVYSKISLGYLVLKNLNIALAYLK